LGAEDVDIALGIARAEPQPSGVST